MAETTTGLPFASVVVYVYGVGPPGVPGVGAGWPTGPWICVVAAVVAAIVGDVVEADVAAEEATVAEVWEEVVAAAPATVCLEPIRRKKRTRRRRKTLAHVTLRPKALVVICSTMVLPALDGD